MPNHTLHNCLLLLHPLRNRLNRDSASRPLHFVQEKNPESAVVCFETQDLWQLNSDSAQPGHCGKPGYDPVRYHIGRNCRELLHRIQHVRWDRYNAPPHWQQ